MYERFITAVLVISIILLILLYFGYKSPAKENNEDEDDYVKRLNDYECTYNASRNLLLVVLIFSGGAYVHCLAKKQGVIRGGAIESMESDEPDLYKSEKSEKIEEESIVSDISSAEE